MAPFDGLRKMFRRGRTPAAPARDTQIFPNLYTYGNPAGKNRPQFKPTQRNLRYFSHTPYARRAVNAIKNPIAMLEWEVRPKKGIKMTPELQRQADIATFCLHHPNLDDNFQSFAEQVIEDILCGAGAIEHQISADPLRPLWMWPVDGLSIQIYPMWSGNPSEARYLQSLGFGLVQGSASGVNLRNDELIYIRPNPSTATPFGFGPVEMAFNSISRQLGVADYAGKVAANATPSIALNLGDIDQDALPAFRAWWIDTIEGQGTMPIFGFGGADKIKPEVIDLRAHGDEGLYLKYQEFLIREIAVAFDVSPQNMGMTGNVNRTDSEVSEDRDRDQAIKPYARSFASHITREALHGRLGYHLLEFVWIGLDPEDHQALAEIGDTMYRMNAATPNEWRERMGMPPLDNKWANLTFADTQVAMEAARGMKDNFDEQIGPTGPGNLAVDPNKAADPKAGAPGKPPKPKGN